MTKPDCCYWLLFTPIHIPDIGLINAIGLKVIERTLCGVPDVPCYMPWFSYVQPVNGQTTASMKQTFNHGTIFIVMENKA